MRVPAKGFALAVLLAIALLTEGAVGAVRYASPTGSGKGCKRSSPCTLRKAVEGRAVRPGDEVVVLPGTHQLGDKRVEVDKAITVHGAPGRPRPKVTASGSTTLWVLHRGAVVRDLELIGTTPTSSGVAVGDGTLERVIARAPLAGCQLAVAEPRQRPLIRDSFCWASSRVAGQGIFWSQESRRPRSWTGRLRNVTAVGGGYGIVVRGTGGPVDLRLDAVNVIAWGATHADVSAEAWSGGNTVHASLRYSNYDERATATGLGGSSAEVTSPVERHNQTAAPEFRDRSGGDFHQLDVSPTIDAGTDTPQNGARDVDGQPRDQGRAPDIGGDEASG